MKIDFSNVPNSEVIDDLVTLIKNKEKDAKVKKDGKSVKVEGLSSRKLKFYAKKVLGRIDAPGITKVVSQGDHFLVIYKE
ncbi:MAG: hypothetical protein EAX86_00920 [Candidatus Heimdallarchaeota archaeon]|nr:hypothetical protein [Candidatus Heimdallarchaeota archaeon]